MVVACLCAALLGSPGMLMGQHRPPPAASQNSVLFGWILPISVKSTLGFSTDEGAAAADPSYGCSSSASYLVSLSAVNTNNEHQLMQYTDQLAILTGPGPQHHLLSRLNKMAAQYNSSAKPPPQYDSRGDKGNYT